jgi:hypothetical protein
MASCEVCGNEYDKAFELIAAGRKHTFDSSNARFKLSRPFASIASAG